jgi:uncharacterized protein
MNTSPDIRITGLYTYPVKSCGRLVHDSFVLDERGPLNDRRWMVVDVVDGFLTQRENPKMALVQPSFKGGQLVLSAPGMGSIEIPEGEKGKRRLLVGVWRDECEAVDEGADAAQFLSEHLGQNVRLVRMADDEFRAVDPNFARSIAQVGFADGYPMLMISEASLADLNEHLVARGKETVPMTRFRPNIVIAGCEAFAEDEWRQVSVGDIPLDIVKACARCVQTTVDQQTGTRPDVKEPLATLATYRTVAHGAIFGQNIIHRAMGTLHVGDAVEVVEVVEPAR